MGGQLGGSSYPGRGPASALGPCHLLAGSPRVNSSTFLGLSLLVWKMGAISSYLALREDSRACPLLSNPDGSIVTLRVDRMLSPQKDCPGAQACARGCECNLTWSAEMCRSEPLEVVMKAALYLVLCKDTVQRQGVRAQAGPRRRIHSQRRQSPLGREATEAEGARWS